MIWSPCSRESTKPATYSAKNRLFYIERHGYGETVFFDISYSAAPETDLDLPD